jgi:hypothetical protein
MRTNRSLPLAIAAIGLLLGAGDAAARGAAEGPVIYVESQGLYYDSILAAKELPPRGPFQQLYPSSGPAIGAITEDAGG